MTPYKTVAVAGATGNLGPTLVDELVKAGFEVTIFSRSGKAENVSSGVKQILKVDYESEDSLATALKGQDVFVSNVPNHDGQKKLIDAAIAAGVKRFIPSEFGSDVYGDENTAALPVFKDGKLPIEQYLQQKETIISWTLVVTGLFLDWGLGLGLQINPKGTTRLYDDGNKQCSNTLLRDIGKAVVSVLLKPEETKNRPVYIQSTCVSQNELLRIARKQKPDLKGDTEPVDVEQLAKDSYAMLEKGENVGGAMFNFIFVSVYGAKYHSNWNDKNDNDLLGIKELSQKELEELVTRYL